ncbi:hypothetical protein [Halomonas sp. SpR8]|uniref:hypothetical protein n=1 Tax=Halomonas sp. SpR8 TaxID=3050463 RepID=UPI0027E40D7C|nr:hypothetical protein [Halomonas sp. SpR8]MDQ7731059.1 hypothetical protein [Halomonas sp. SpR8]
MTFAPELLTRLRSMSVVEALRLLELYWKRDSDFQPVKNQNTERLNVAISGGVVELLVTGPKWFDTRAEKGGGGGAIDLVMHFLRLDFVAAVKRLEERL